MFWFFAWICNSISLKMTVFISRRDLKWDEVGFFRYDQNSIHEVFMIFCIKLDYALKFWDQKRLRIYPKQFSMLGSSLFFAWSYNSIFWSNGLKKRFFRYYKKSVHKSFFCIKYSSIKAWYWLVWFFGKNLFSLFSYCWVKKGPKWSFSSFVKNQWIELLHFLQEVITALRLKINPNELFSENSCTGFFEQKEAQSECFKVL